MISNISMVGFFFWGVGGLGILGFFGVCVGGGVVGVFCCCLFWGVL